jgi:hypothetical protein
MLLISIFRSEGGTRTRDTTIMSRVLEPEGSDDGSMPEILDDYGDVAPG